MITPPPPTARYRHLKLILLPPDPTRPGDVHAVHVTCQRCRRTSTISLFGGSEPIGQVLSSLADYHDTCQKRARERHQ